MGDVYLKKIFKKKKKKPSLLKIFIYIFIWLCQVLVVACGNQFPDQGLKPDSLHWE